MSVAPKLNDFTCVKVLGKGSYGKVMLVKSVRDESTIFAMKMLRKEHVVKRNQVEHTKTERSVLESVSHPFIVRLHYAFQTPKKLYLVMEFCGAGELFYHLSRAGRFSNNKTRFYIAEATSAIAYLHTLAIIYRDLKPENLLLDVEGHVKLTDFGLSKAGIRDNVSATTICGTPEYFAPELLKGPDSVHGKAVDWYSVGALTFEMLTSLPPFYTKDRQKLYKRIAAAVLTYPDYVQPTAKSFVESMLHRDPEQRLGSGPGSGQEVKTHPFFNGIDWVLLDAREVEPPFRPDVAFGDLKYFEPEFTGMPVVNSEVGEDGKEMYKFEGFTYAGKRP
mmetsp:Transcript_924/g.2257  ORF Transcript_924/g.2257 Transcript_924/m.2257 type:complete len:334 (-) Transcript_924:226-1227(-)